MITKFVKVLDYGYHIFDPSKPPVEVFIDVFKITHIRKMEVSVRARSFYAVFFDNGSSSMHTEEFVRSVVGNAFDAEGV